MNTEQLKEQANKLEDYINYGTVKEKDWGLCQNVLIADFPTPSVFRSWEHYSGSGDYPVGNGKRDYLRNEGMHNRNTQYGKLRLSLAKHCLDWTLTQLRDTV